MQYQDGYFENVEQTPIFYQYWSPQQPIKAVMLIVHGLGEHSGRYANLVQRFVPQGFVVYGFDHQGHGKSSGPKGHIDSFQAYILDLNMMVERVKALYPGVPLVLFGHSMGGLITASYLVENQDRVSAAILSSPAIQAPDNVPRYLLKIGRWLSKFWPTLPVVQLESQGICRNSDVVKAYDADPLVNHGKMSARLGQELLDQMAWLRSQMTNIRLPMLVVQGEHDLLVDASGAQQLIDNLGSNIKKIIMYKGLYHELINEPEREIVLNDIELWVRERLGLYSTQDIVSQYRKIS